MKLKNLYLIYYTNDDYDKMKTPTHILYKFRLNKIVSKISFTLILTFNNP